MEYSDVIAGAISRHREALEGFNRGVREEAGRAANVLRDAIARGKKVLACGNGGSAADAEHFIGELLCRYKDDRKPLRGISLASQTSALTAIGNDYNFETVFARQVEALGDAGDVLLAITTSGKSKNVIAAMRAARSKGMRIVALTGRVGGTALRDEADIVVAIPSDETARIQEMHELVYHSWCEFLDAEVGAR
jgi:phosphoheptose isomerase